jgi:hypothetical protein
MVFPNAKLYEEGHWNIDDEIDGIREAILIKDGIVPPESKEDFNFFVQNCLNKQMLEQFGGDMSQYNNESFRLMKRTNTIV